MAWSCMEDDSSPPSTLSRKKYWEQGWICSGILLSLCWLSFFHELFCMNITMQMMLQKLEPLLTCKINQKLSNLNLMSTYLLYSNSEENNYHTWSIKSGERSFGQCSRGSKLQQHSRLLKPHGNCLTYPLGWVQDCAIWRRLFYLNLFFLHVDVSSASRNLKWSATHQAWVKKKKFTRIRLSSQISKWAGFTSMDGQKSCSENLIKMTSH